MNRTTFSAIALGVFLLATGVSATLFAQDEAASVSLDSVEAGYWCYDSYYGWYPCSWDD